MTLKLIAVLFQINALFIQKFCQSCNFDSIAKYYNENSSVNVLKAMQLLVASGWAGQKELANIVGTTEKILKHYVVSGQEIYLEYPLDIMKYLVKVCPEKGVQGVWEIVVDLQAHQDVVIREKAEDLIQEFIKEKKVAGKGKWDVKGKKGRDNYDKYVKMTGEKGTGGRYK